MHSTGATNQPLLSPAQHPTCVARICLMVSGSLCGAASTLEMTGMRGSCGSHRTGVTGHVWQHKSRPNCAC